MQPQPGYYVGVDGCRKGWVSVVLQDGEAPRLDVYEDIESLWCTHYRADAILIDMPIGLPETGPDERECEIEARQHLGLRRSSVFPVPCRRAVYAESRHAAVEANRRHMHKSLSLQSLLLCKRIRELDELLRSESRARDVFREAHPELLFCGMNGGTPMTYAKKTVTGADERQALLATIVGEEVVAGLMAKGRRYRRRDLQGDDVLDALACAIAVSHPDRLGTLLANPPVDACGLPMQLVYWRPKGLPNGSSAGHYL
ncbi:MAG: DUF429 domain-containing protein [Chloroflexota bacterium]